MRKLLIAAVFFVVVWFEAGAAQSQTKIYVGLSTFNSRVTPLWIAQERGFFAKNGLEVLLVLTRVSQPAIAALLAGEMQMVLRRVDRRTRGCFQWRRSQGNCGTDESLDL